MEFLHAADLHIDSPLRGLDRYEGAPVERLRNATRAALERLVDAALARRVDFVLLAGDIFDRDWQDFHTGLFFREQMVRLHRGGIPVFMILGNHDAQGVITRQLPWPENVTVFSSRRPETHRLDPLQVALHGRSFPDRAVEEDWVPAYPDPVPGYFNIGLLHTSLGGRPGHDRYAPTDAATLAARGYDYWALGHVHTREVVSETPWIVFPGNLQGRHANETGPKGCERVRVTPAGVEVEPLELDEVRWHRLRVDLHGVEDLVPLGRTVTRSLGSALPPGDERLHAVRVTLAGAGEGLHHLEARVPGTLEAQVRAAAQDLDGIDVWIERVDWLRASPVDRAVAAARDDAVGELVRQVDALLADPGAARTLVEAQLAELRQRLPAEVDPGLLDTLQDPEGLRALLLDAEATVRARLEDGEGETE
ncbi:metallophosphoesterase family protein [Ectothiorhodospira mobilis]|uniref:metallophosphoesterase family protein n=1 Tax=Ectothiorhodospira mobilis TaxID=195064 RepID=UPI0019051F42|nr:DNA repair exonuclease [Ectothiorhodospira mobilis]MBK1690759.1 metallophosphoesterase [Ectothiorhodospira mobilis]